MGNFTLNLNNTALRSAMEKYKNEISKAIENIEGAAKNCMSEVVIKCASEQEANWINILLKQKDNDLQITKADASNHNLLVRW